MRFRNVSVVVFLAVFLFGSAAFASNMGFKAVYSLGGVFSYQNWIALPYNFAATDAAGLWADIDAADPGNIVTFIGYWDEATATTISYYGYEDPPYSVNFALDKKMSYVVGVNYTVNYVIVGSHNPTAALDLGDTNSYQNWVSVPYHTTRTDAAGIWTDIQEDLCPIDQDCVSFLGYWNEATAETISYYGYEDPPYSVNFPLVVGRGIVVGVNYSNTTWSPSHY